MEKRLLISTSRKRLLPPHFLLGALIIMIFLHFLFPAINLLSQPWNLMGVLPLGLGLVVSILAEKQFHRAKTTVKPFIPASTLVTDGLFQYSRNPMYLGFSLVLLGVSMILGSLTPFLVIPVFVTTIQHVFIQVEEKMMAESFGSDWFNYSRKTRRWL